MFILLKITCKNNKGELQTSFYHYVSRDNNFMINKTNIIAVRSISRSNTVSLRIY